MLVVVEGVVVVVVVGVVLLRIVGVVVGLGFVRIFLVLDGVVVSGLLLRLLPPLELLPLLLLPEDRRCGECEDGCCCWPLPLPLVVVLNIPSAPPPIIKR